MVDTSITLKVIRERAPEIAELRPYLHPHVEIWVLPRGGKTGSEIHFLAAGASGEAEALMRPVPFGIAAGAPQITTSEFPRARPRERKTGAYRVVPPRVKYQPSSNPT